MRQFKKIVDTLILLCVISATVVMFSGSFLGTSNTAVLADSYEYALFPNKTVKVKQVAYGSYSHSGKNAVDFVPDGDVVAPFSGTIRYRAPSWGFVWLESDNEIYWADGTRGKMCVGFMHDEDISDLPVGKHLKQGEPFYQKGKKAATKEGQEKIDGAHVHLIIHRGAYSSSLENGYGNKGNAYIYDAFYLSEDMKVHKESKYKEDKWKRLDFPINTSIEASCDSSVITGSTINLNWTSERAASYKLHIVKDGTDFLNENLENKTKWTGKFTKLGKYECTVIPFSDNGKEGPSDSLSFTVVPMYVAPQISDLEVTYSGYNYIEVKASITEPGLGILKYEVGLWEGSSDSPSFRTCGETRVEGNTIYCKMPVVENFIDSNVSKFLGKELTIGLKGIDTLNIQHFGLNKKTHYEYKYPVPSETKKFENHTYYRFDQGYTWEDACNFAEKETNGYLVCIGSENENRFLESMAFEGTMGAYFTGGRLDSSVGKWTWTDSTPFSYTNWAKGFPASKNANCSALVFKPEGWQNFSPDIKSSCGFIIEVEKSVKNIPTAYPTSTPTPSPVPTAKPKPVVKVTNAVNKKITFYEDESKGKVTIPKVSISGINMDAVNNKIKKELLNKKRAIKYSYYKNDKIVSICVEIQGWKDSDYERVVYNISVETGKLISGSEVVKIYGSTDEKLFNMVKKDYNKDDFGILFDGRKKPTKKQQKQINELRKKNLNRISYKYVEPYITKKGKLSYVSSHYWYNVEAGEVYLIHV